MNAAFFHVLARKIWKVGEGYVYYCTCGYTTMDREIMVQHINDKRKLMSI